MSRPRPHRHSASAWALALVFAIPAPASAQDEGTFIVRQAGREIGREDFTLQTGREGGADGTTIVSHTRYPGLAPSAEGRVIVERRADGTFAAAQFDLDQGRSIRHLLIESGNRLLRIRASGGGNEAVRELPASPDVVILDDSSFALYLAVAQLATPEGRRLVGVFPASGRRVPFSARRDAGDDPSETRIILAGGLTGTLWLDAQGRLDRLAFPGEGLEVGRLRH